MSPLSLIAYYCLFILLASIIGGMIPVWFRLTHRGMQFAVSVVAGVMLGVGVLHMLPHAVRAAQAADPTGAGQPVIATMWWLLAGMLTMFFIERLFCYHHHDVPDDSEPGHAEHEGPCEHHDHAHADHTHDLSWSGAAWGLALHSILAGVALAASVQHSHGDVWLAGLGTFLVIFLHKPFDSMTIGTLMARSDAPLARRQVVNGLFALAVPVGVLLFYFGLMPAESAADGGASRQVAAYALAFSAGTFLCISLSDLLPELQFHRHDRVKLSAALVLGITVAIAAAKLESLVHGPHSHGAAPPAQSSPNR